MKSVEICEECGSENLIVYDTRISPNGTRRRSRKCVDCGKRQHTVEIDREDFEEMKFKLLKYKSVYKSIVEVVGEDA